MKLTFDQTTTIVGFATKSIVTSGAAAIITNAVKATTPEDVTRLKRITIWAGTAAISGMVAEHAGKHVMSSYGKIVKSVKDVIVNDPSDPDVVSGEVIND